MDPEYSNPPQDECFETTVEKKPCARQFKLVSRKDLFVWYIIAIIIILSCLMLHKRKPEFVPPEYGQS